MTIRLYRDFPENKTQKTCEIIEQECPTLYKADGTPFQIRVKIGFRPNDEERPKHADVIRGTG